MTTNRHPKSEEEDLNILWTNQPLNMEDNALVRI